MGGAGPKPGAEQPLWMGNSATNSTPNEKTAEKSSAKGGVRYRNPREHAILPGSPGGGKSARRGRKLGHKLRSE